MRLLWRKKNWKQDVSKSDENFWVAVLERESGSGFSRVLFVFTPKGRLSDNEISERIGWFI